MGVYRDISECEIEFVKEMAEGLGSSGLILEALLAKAVEARSRSEELLNRYNSSKSDAFAELINELNQSIFDYNALVGKCEEALRWLLIQREACGFRTHKNVSQFYPIPERLIPVKQ
ncbi:MAG: hypothetical protein V1897_09745 [Pseudomonadota bacterium]